MSAHADRLAQRVVEHPAGNGDRLAFDLRGPTGKVFKVLNHLWQIDVQRLLDRLTVVQRFQFSQFFRVLLDQLRKSIKQPAAIPCTHAGPFAFERATSSSDGFVDVCSVGLGDFGERLAGGGVRRGKSLAGFRIDPLTVNEELVFARRGGLGCLCR